MYFLLQPEQNSYQRFDNEAALLKAELSDNDLRIFKAGDLLERYVATDDDNPEMALLCQLRDLYIDDLDAVFSAAEVTGLMAWLLRDKGIDFRGESLEDTADRLGDLDIEADSDQYTDLIFHLKDAVERIYDLQLDDD
ncbi:hypothetical protein [Marinobacterium jannaschii]|uniref:hypothetical protein n=1 Tax=Marinobacterium jannaschii TaxID=64970 RepID=UPI000484E4D7|nr:hypothetical protein [Marinobacterium jannaschii]